MCFRETVKGQDITPNTLKVSIDHLEIQRSLKLALELSS